MILYMQVYLLSCAKVHKWKKYINTYINAQLTQSAFEKWMAGEENCRVFSFAGIPGN